MPQTASITSQSGHLVQQTELLFVSDILSDHFLRNNQPMTCHDRFQRVDNTGFFLSFSPFRLLYHTSARIDLIHDRLHSRQKHALTKVRLNKDRVHPETHCIPGYLHHPLSWLVAVVSPDMNQIEIAVQTP